MSAALGGKRQSLLKRALFSNTALFVILSILLTGTSLITVRGAFARQFEIRAEALAAFLTAEAAYPLLVGDEVQLRRMAESALKDEDVLSVQIADIEGRMDLRLARQGVSLEGEQDAGRRVRVRRQVLAPRKDALLDWETPTTRAEVLGSVEVGLSLATQEGLFYAVLTRVLLAGGCALAAILALQFVQMRRLLQPLKILTDFTRAVGEGRLEGRAPVNRRDELGELADSFNEMVRQLATTTVSRDYVDNIVRSMGDALIVTDVDLSIRTINGSALDLLGYERGDLVGQNIDLLTSSPARIQAMTAGWNGQPVHFSDETLRHRSGREVPVMLTLSLLTARSGDPMGVVLLAQDISERKRAQAALVAAKEAAEESSRAKSTFLANMSHELRTPLNAIINYSEMLKEEAVEAGQSEQASDLEMIRSSGKHLLTLVSDILDLSKIEAGRMQVQIQTVQLDEVLREVQMTCYPLAHKNGTVLTVEDEGAVTVWADPIRVKQVVLNLVSNACKFTQGGAVRVHWSRERADGQDWVCCAVADTGIGIAKEDMTKLFRSFSQVDGSQTRKFGGTGLGLAISQKLAELMGGKITVSSAPGQGSTFTLWLRPERWFEEAKQENRRVLLLDEDPRRLAALLPLWRHAGYEVDFATTGDEAVRKVQASQPSLTLIQVQSAARLSGRRMETILSARNGHGLPIALYALEETAGDEEELRMMAMWRYQEASRGAAAVVSRDAERRRRSAQVLLRGGFQDVAQFDSPVSGGAGDSFSMILVDLGCAAEAVLPAGLAGGGRRVLALPFLAAQRGRSADEGVAWLVSAAKGELTGESARAIYALMRALNEHSAEERTSPAGVQRSDDA